MRACNSISPDQPISCCSAERHLSHWILRTPSAAPPRLVYLCGDPLEIVVLQGVVLSDVPVEHVPVCPFGMLWDVHLLKDQSS
jgi:hypothetical protein